MRWVVADCPLQLRALRLGPLRQSNATGLAAWQVTRGLRSVGHLCRSAYVGRKKVGDTRGATPEHRTHSVRSKLEFFVREHPKRASAHFVGSHDGRQPCQSSASSSSR